MAVLMDAADLPESPAGATPAPTEAAVIPEQAALARSTRRWVLAALGVVTIAGVALGLSWVAQDKWHPNFTPATHGIACPSRAITPAAPEDVQVNVFNATETDGLAVDAASSLQERGFHTGLVKNSDMPEETGGAPAVVISGPGTTEAALAVQRQVPRSRVLLQAERTDGTVDLVLGEDFQRLVTPGKASSARGKLRCVARIMTH